MTKEEKSEYMKKWRAENNYNKEYYKLHRSEILFNKWKKRKLKAKSEVKE